MKVNQFIIFFVVFLLGILFSHIIGGDLIEGKYKHCRHGRIYNKKKRRCVCRRGTIFDKDKGKCVLKSDPTKPPITSRSTKPTSLPPMTCSEFNENYFSFTPVQLKSPPDRYFVEYDFYILIKIKTISIFRRYLLFKGATLRLMVIHE